MWLYAYVTRTCIQFETGLKQSLVALVNADKASCFYWLKHFSFWAGQGGELVMISQSNQYVSCSMCRVVCVGPASWRHQHLSPGSLKRQNKWPPSSFPKLCWSHAVWGVSSRMKGKRWREIQIDKDFGGNMYSKKAAIFSNSYFFWWRHDGPTHCT